MHYDPATHAGGKSVRPHQKKRNIRILKKDKAFLFSIEPAFRSSGPMKHQD
ncbi:MAG: hypothetical protein V1775_06240 [Bacteroidota bacterium]